MACPATGSGRFHRPGGKVLGGGGGHGFERFLHDVLRPDALYPELWAEHEPV